MTPVVRAAVLRDRAPVTAAPGDGARSAPAPVPSPSSAFRHGLTNSEFFLKAQIGLRSVFGGLLGDRTLERGGARLDLL